MQLVVHKLLLEVSYVECTCIRGLLQQSLYKDDHDGHRTVMILILLLVQPFFRINNLLSRLTITLQILKMLEKQHKKPSIWKGQLGHLRCYQPFCFYFSMKPVSGRIKAKTRTELLLEYYFFSVFFVLRFFFFFKYFNFSLFVLALLFIIIMIIITNNNNNTIYNTNNNNNNLFFYYYLAWSSTIPLEKRKTFCYPFLG